MIPISLVYRADLHQAGQPMPCLLYGYGSYGYSIDPGFNSNRVSLLDRGFIWAIAHIRGGEDLGRAWYDQGKFLNKRNTFTDFIGCARHLIAEQYTTPDRLAIMGRSAVSRRSRRCALCGRRDDHARRIYSADRWRV
jgi:oligopeptidase B